MRTVTVHGKKYHVVYTYNPGRFPQRQHTFTHDEEVDGISHLGIRFTEPQGSGRTAKIAWRAFVVTVKHAQQDTNRVLLMEASGKSSYVVSHEADFNSSVRDALEQPGDLSIEAARRLAAQFYSVRVETAPASFVNDPNARKALITLVREYISTAYARHKWAENERRWASRPVSVHMHVAPDIKPKTIEALGQLVTVACAAADRGEL